MSDEPVNALGQPSPNRTDFKAWSREALERFAREAADENLLLRTDLKALHQFIRNKWKEEL